MDKINEEHLRELFSRLDIVQKKYINVAAQIIKAGDQKMYYMDLFTMDICNRAIALVKGFLTLSKENNYFAAVPLIRMQVDNCLQLFASSIVEDQNKFYHHYLAGHETRDYKDKSGKKMTDGYLSRELDKEVPGMQKVYKSTSGYVHLSSVHSTASVKEDREISFHVGKYDGYTIENKVDFANNMLVVSIYLHDMLYSWKVHKEKNSFKPAEQNNGDQ